MTTLDNNSLVKTALDAVMSGAKIADAARGSHIVNHKGNLRDIVTQTDIDISDLLIKKLKTTGLPVISEENPVSGNKTPDTFWVVDPIDGTVNFSHGLAQYAVSAGLVERGAFQLGVVCLPAMEELYLTLNPTRALLNGRPFTHTHGSKNNALVAASFGAKGIRAYYDFFQQVNETTQGCLRTGSAALNICWAASGKLQAAYGFQAKLWDVAGALAVARAAGAELVLRHEPNSLILDYCVGSHEAVAHIMKLAKENHLWE